MIALTRWLGFASGVAALACVLFLPWLAIFRRTRRAAGVGYITCSYIIGGTLWIMCFLTVWDAWGGFWALAGVLVLGVGVLPMSLVIFAIDSVWVLFIEVIVLATLAMGVRAIGIWLITKADKS